MLLLLAIQGTSFLDRYKPLHLVIIASLRTVLDYALNWKMFFPPATEESKP